MKLAWRSWLHVDERSVRRPLAILASIPANIENILAKRPPTASHSFFRSKLLILHQSGRLMSNIGGHLASTRCQPCIRTFMVR
jgi:hypothetical protein